MGSLFDPKNRIWIIQVTILSIVLGALLAAALKTQQRVKTSTGIPTTRFSGLAQALLDEKDKNKLLRDQVTELLTKLDQYEQTQGTADTELLRQELRTSKLLAGLTPVEGEGIEVILQDYPAVPANTPAVLKDQYIIHDLDIRDIINELLAGGAEAISIADDDTEQRVISLTGIRCVGGTALVNQVEMTSPFVIRAIGPSNGLERVLTMPNGLLDNWRPIEGLAERMVKIRKKDHIVIPPYSGNVGSLFIWAKPVEPERKKP